MLVGKKFLNIFFLYKLVHIFINFKNFTTLIKLEEITLKITQNHIVVFPFLKKKAS